MKPPTAQEMFELAEKYGIIYNKDAETFNITEPFFKFFKENFLPCYMAAYIKLTSHQPIYELFKMKLIIDNKEPIHYFTIGELTEAYLTHYGNKNIDPIVKAKISHFLVTFWTLITDMAKDDIQQLSKVIK